MKEEAEERSRDQSIVDHNVMFTRVGFSCGHLELRRSDFCLRKTMETGIWRIGLRVQGQQLY